MSLHGLRQNCARRDGCRKELTLSLPQRIKGYEGLESIFPFAVENVCCTTGVRHGSFR
jgi:hypothetical protein